MYGHCPAPYRFYLGYRTCRLQDGFHVHHLEKTGFVFGRHFAAIFDVRRHGHLRPGHYGDTAGQQKRAVSDRRHILRDRGRVTSHSHLEQRKPCIPPTCDLDFSFRRRGSRPIMDPMPAREASSGAATALVWGRTPSPVSVPRHRIRLCHHDGLQQSAQIRGRPSQGLVRKLLSFLLV